MAVSHTTADTFTAGAPNAGPSAKAKLLLGALGVVYGDIGTSPLYAIKECFIGHNELGMDPVHVLGVLSLIFWAVTTVVTVKYVSFVMRADNRGEGGSLALLALVIENTRGRRVAATTDGSASTTVTCRACGPRRPSMTPNSTFCPGLSVAIPVGSADDRTCTSAPPSCAMKPKPLSASYHLTLPLGTQLTLSRLVAPRTRGSPGYWPAALS